LVSDSLYSGARTTVKPGQVWLIEHTSARALFLFDRAVLTSADVVIYDRALAPVVASVLPLGAYAEPMPLDMPLGGQALSSRALGFAVDGWSVVQLVETHADRRSRLRLTSDALVSLGCPGDLPVQVVTKGTPCRHRERFACLRTLPDLADDLADDDLLSLAFGPLVVRYPRPCYAFAANGLAG
jgi:siroheme synthase